MFKQTLNQQWDLLRQKHSAYLGLLQAIPADRFHSHPVPGMRTPAELAVHMSGSILKNIAQGVARGEIAVGESVEGKFLADLGTKAAVIAYAKRCWNEADEAMNAIGDEELSATVRTPWNRTFPGWVALSVLNDEFLHFHGQLYTYAWLCGAESEVLVPTEAALLS